MTPARLIFQVGLTSGAQAAISALKTREGGTRSFTTNRYSSTGTLTAALLSALLPACGKRRKEDE